MTVWLAVLWTVFILVIGTYLYFFAKARWLTVALMPVVYALGLVVLSNSLSRCGPMPMAWIEAQLSDSDSVTVEHATWKEGKAIYVWLGVPWSAEPRSYCLPWSRKQVEELYKAQKEAEKGEGNVRMKMQNMFYGQETEEEPLFYAEPQPAPPPKEGAG